MSGIHELERRPLCEVFEPGCGLMVVKVFLAHLPGFLFLWRFHDLDPDVSRNRSGSLEIAEWRCCC